MCRPTGHNKGRNGYCEPDVSRDRSSSLLKGGASWLVGSHLCRRHPALVTHGTRIGGGPGMKLGQSRAGKGLVRVMPCCAPSSSFVMRRIHTCCALRVTCGCESFDALPCAVASFSSDSQGTCHKSSDHLRACSSPRRIDPLSSWCCVYP